MIEKNNIIGIVNEWLEGKDYFLVDVTVSPDDEIVVEIDHADGVWIEDCVELSRYIESKLNRDEEDFGLEVGSAGIGQPFKVHQQYVNHVDKDVEVLAGDGRKYRGVLSEATDDTFTVVVNEKVLAEGAKRPKMEPVPHTWRYDEVKYVKATLTF
jgi:ribosome maturation factor RimP